MQKEYLTRWRTCKSFWIYMSNFLLREHLLRERGFVETELAISHTHRVSLTYTGSRTGWSRSNW